MNEIVNKFLLASDKFMPKTHLKQPGFTYSGCGPFKINKERIQEFKETGDTNHIYKNELDQACFQHDMDFGDFKDLARRTASDKVLRDKTFYIAKNSKYGGCHRGLASIVYNFLIKSLQAVVLICMQINLLLMKNQLKNYTKHFLKNLADMQLMIKFNKGFRFLLCY